MEAAVLGVGVWMDGWMDGWMEVPGAPLCTALLFYEAFWKPWMCRGLQYCPPGQWDLLR